MRFISDAKSNPLRGNEFEVDVVKLIVDHADQSGVFVAAGTQQVGVLRHHRQQAPEPLPFREVQAHPTGMIQQAGGILIDTVAASRMRSPAIDCCTGWAPKALRLQATVKTKNRLILVMLNSDM